MTIGHRRLVWTILAKALGEKSHPHNQLLSDCVAAVRLVIVLSYLLTNAFICAGVMRHWNSVV